MAQIVRKAQVSPSGDAAPAPDWWARGLLFENCNCQAVCPGHVHFDQLCTHARCLGYWAVRFDEGEFGGVELGGLAAVIAYDSPQHMIDGDWTQSLVVDHGATGAQVEALERIFDGSAGGPWAVLARFVGRRLDTRCAPIHIDDRGKAKRVIVEGLLDGAIEAIRGRDRGSVVTFENMFNQIHAPRQVIAKGSTRYDDGSILVDTAETHALFSEFSWSGRAD
jgi:hypothetical protein